MGRGLGVGLSTQEGTVSMGRFDNLPLLPSTIVGSHGKGSWWYAGVREFEKGVWGEGDLAEMLDDAADTAIRDMTKAGLDVITDGEVRRLDGTSIRITRL